MLSSDQPLHHVSSLLLHFPAQIYSALSQGINVSLQSFISSSIPFGDLLRILKKIFKFCKKNDRSLIEKIEMFNGFLYSLDISG